MQPIGEILVAKELISREQLGEVLEKQKNSPKRLGEILVDDGILSQEQLNLALAERLGVESIGLAEYEIDALGATMITDKTSKRYGDIPTQVVVMNSSVAAQVVPPRVLAIVGWPRRHGQYQQPAIVTAV